MNDYRKNPWYWPLIVVDVLLVVFVLYMVGQKYWLNFLPDIGLTEIIIISPLFIAVIIFYRLYIGYKPPQKRWYPRFRVKLRSLRKIANKISDVHLAIIFALMLIGAGFTNFVQIAYMYEKINIGADPFTSAMAGGPFIAGAAILLFLVIRWQKKRDKYLTRLYRPTRMLSERK